MSEEMCLYVKAYADRKYSFLEERERHNAPFCHIRQKLQAICWRLCGLPMRRFTIEELGMSSCNFKVLNEILTQHEGYMLIMQQLLLERGSGNFELKCEALSGLGRCQKCLRRARQQQQTYTRAIILCTAALNTPDRQAVNPC